MKTLKIYEAANKEDPEDLTNEKDRLWLARALRGDFGAYQFSGPYDEDGDAFVVMTKL